MKRADLKVLEDYAVHDSNNWLSYPTTRPLRYRVLDTGGWWHSGLRTSLETIAGIRVAPRARPTLSTDAGDGVLAIKVNHVTGEPTTCVRDGEPVVLAMAIRAQVLRAPWDEGIQKWTVADEARREAVREQFASRQAAQARQDRIVNALREAMAPTDVDGVMLWGGANEHQIILSVDLAETILERLKAAQEDA